MEKLLCMGRGFLQLFTFLMVRGNVLYFLSKNGENDYPVKEPLLTVISPKLP